MSVAPSNKNFFLLKSLIFTFFGFRGLGTCIQMFSIHSTEKKHCFKPKSRDSSWLEFESGLYQQLMSGVSPLSEAIKSMPPYYNTEQI